VTNPASPPVSGQPARQGGSGRAGRSRAWARPPPRHRRPLTRPRLARPAGIVLLACGVLVTALGLGGWALSARHGGAPAGPPPGGIAQIPVPRGAVARPPGPSGRRRVSRPVRLVIPAIRVDTRLLRLGLTSAHTLQVPVSAAIAGWFTGSPRPGATGASIIAGHIDSTSGPGVFYKLHDLRRGQRVYVTRANKSVAKFRVTAVREYAKTHFPTAAVYGPVPDAELRLITCGGSFDYATGSYLSNVVVYAVLVR